jgi:ABC-type sulfate transport system substrate-binding protein
VAVWMGDGLFQNFLAFLLQRTLGNPKPTKNWNVKFGDDWHLCFPSSLHSPPSIYQAT